MPTSHDPDAPDRGLWMAWTLAFVGGIVVMAAVAIALLDPCLGDDRVLGSDPCAASSSPALVTATAGIGTVLAVVGGATAAVLTVRRRRR